MLLARIASLLGYQLGDNTLLHRLAQWAAVAENRVRAIHAAVLAVSARVLNGLAHISRPGRWTALPFVAPFGAITTAYYLVAAQFT